MARPPAPSIPRAEGMLAALTASHTCGIGCNGTAYVGGHPIQLTCPYARLSVNDKNDRRIIGMLYADAARAAMPRS